MNHAYVDGSHEGSTGGWGVILLRPGEPDREANGVATLEDNGACEVYAVLQAVLLAPPGEPLTVHTDASCAVQAVRRGTAHPHQNELGVEVRRVAHERGIALHVTLGPRDARRARQAHLLASRARLGEAPPEVSRPEVRVRVRRIGWGSEASFTFRRGGETRRVPVPLPPREGVPPALLALAALVDEARDGEHLSVRMDSALAPTLWANTRAAGSEEAREIVDGARRAAEERGVTLEFV